MLRVIGFACEQSGSETFSTLSTTRVSTTNSATHEGSTTAGAIGIGLAVGLLCTVGAVAFIIVLRRRKLLPCSKTTSKSNIGSQTFGDV
ncbi:hypothetical protein DPMN_077610 [Dreissena polymorpha]|uniref:Uncharacterized protein n=1 Tax=Dreissena polymorpha TaxID=45954 RepID=A0A9D4BPT1_DREPO|nr:hypothetical protein DPMN_077610 [Dreissena polymorpha]